VGEGAAERLVPAVYEGSNVNIEWKCFYYDKSAGKYSIIEPEDMYTMVYEAWALEDSIFPFVGMSPTGRTQAF
jgi:hypothetical protein